METAAVAGALGVEAFDYNRENFMYDREQRFKKEFKEINFRIEQAGQWREDVREIVDLQQKKSKTYCLVAVITLGFTMSLWCQGRLAIGTPTWVMLGNQVAAGAGFSFLTMVITFAIYASCVAQGYLTRFMTQLVRLPIPTWQEVESCRTYLSSYEKVEGRQMFRVPWVMPQEQQVTSGAGSSTGGRAGERQNESSERGAGSASRPASGRIATDPWGLEARGDNIVELGCKYGRDVASLRHIKLARHAALYYQTYDAFARAALTIGINQVMIGLNYFTLGQTGIALSAPWSSFGGVFSVISVALAIQKLDISLPAKNEFVINFLVFAGPACAWAASYISLFYGEKFARLVAAAGFACHGFLALSMVFFSGVRETPVGDLIPTSFKSVLWLDAFGWVDRNFKADGSIDKTIEYEEYAAPVESPRSHAESNVSHGPVSDATIGYYAMDYFEKEAATRKEAPRSSGSEENRQPGLHTVSYDSKTKQSLPVNYEDFKPNGVANDMRHAPGAPSHHESLNARSLPTDFFHPSSFIPRGVNEDRLPNFPTGHSQERPGYAAWMVFRNASALLGLAWFLAAFYQVLDATRTFTSLDPVFFPKIKGKSYREHLGHVGHHSSLLEVGRTPGIDRTPPQKVTLDLPLLTVQPKGFSCDAAGRNFAVTDGVSAFVGGLQSKDGAAHAEETLVFQETEPCTSLLGESFDDTAIVCDETNATASKGCQVLVLHRQGGRVTRCAVGAEGSSVGHGRTAEIPQQWLHREGQAEKIAWLLADTSCGPGGNSGNDQDSPTSCASVGTTRGRVARLREAKGNLVPDSVLPDEDGFHTRMPGSLQSGSVRALGGHLIGVHQARHSGVQVLDTTQDMADLGTLRLPWETPVAGFCVGGGFVHMLTASEKPEMWKFPLPQELVA